MATDNTKLIFNPLSGNFDTVQNVDALVEGPASSVDNSIPRFHLTSGKVLQGSNVIITDLDAIEGVTELDVDDLNFNGNVISVSTVGTSLNISTANNGAGNSGGIQISTGTSSADRGNFAAYGKTVLLAADDVGAMEGPTRVNLSSDGEIQIYPWSNITPTLNLYEGTGTFSAELSATATGGLEINGEGSIVQVALATNLTPTFWGSDVPGLVIDGTSAAALSAFGAGIIFKGDDGTMNALIATQDRSDALNTASFYLTTGHNTGGAGSGDSNRETGGVNTAGDDSGNILDATGANASGTTGFLRRRSGNGVDTGNIEDTTGTASGTRGEYINDCRQARFLNPIVMDNEKAIQFKEASGNGQNYVSVKAPSSLGSDFIMTLPAATDTFVGKATTDIFTNKTFDADGAGNSITNIENADIKAAAGIVYSKLTLTDSIVNADINSAAAIAVNKLAAVTASRALVSDGSGFVSAATTTSTEIGYVNGVTSAIQTQLNGKVAISTSAQNTNFNAVSGITYLVDSSGGAIVATLPAPSANAWIFIKDIGNASTNSITVDTPGAETIDGDAQHIITSDYGSAFLVSNGTNWFLL